MRIFTIFSFLLLSAVAALAQPSLPLDFESTTITYTFTDFDGGAMTVIANPNSGGINTSAKVARMVKGTGQPWGGSWISLAAPIDFSTNKLFKVKVYSPRVGAKVLLKVENQTNGAINFEKEATATVANAWEELTFDYSTINTSNQYQKLVFILDNGTVGDGGANFTCLFDDIQLVAAGGGGGLTQMNLPVTFDAATVDYGLVGFGGAEASTIVTDPTNASNKVAKVIKAADAQLWAGTTVTALNGTVQTGFSTKIPFTATDKKMSVRVWSPHSGIQIRLKVEDHLDPTKTVETEATSTVANNWETLTFDFATQAAGTAALNLAFNYNKATIFFNFGTTGAAAGERIYYFDDIMFVTGGGGGGLTQMNLPVTFDNATVNYGLTGFGGAEASSIVTDPTNASNKVAKVIKAADAQLWAGTTITALNGTVQTGFSTKIPFTATDKKMSVRVWSPHSGIQVRLKVEDHLDPTKTVETEATSTVANNWETLTFDFATQAAGTAALDLAFNYNKASIFFNFGTTGATAGERTYYFDDVMFATGGGGSNLPVLPLDFESSTIPYTFTDFGGGAAAVVANPQINGINTSAKVGKMVKNAPEVYGGSLISLGAPIDFSVNKSFKVKVFMPKVGAKLLLKVENLTNASVNFEKEVIGTVANAWEELTFDYSTISTANQYQKIVLIFDNGTVGDGGANFTYLFDDIRLVASAGGGSTIPVLPLDFESSTIPYTFTDFGGGAATVLPNPQINGINTSAKVGKMVKNAPEVYGGSSISLASPIDFSVNKSFKVKVYMPKTGAKLLLKVENLTNASINFEKEVIGTVTNTWEELTFDYSTISTANQYQKIVLIFDNGTVGDGGANFTYLFDDIRLVASGGGGGLTQMNLPVTFDDATVNYGVDGFGGAASSIVTDPTMASNKVAKVIKSAGAELWAGTTITALNGAVQTGFSAKIPFTATEKKMNIRVWSPHSGIPVRLKVEDYIDPTKSVETEATSTVANNWETLTFDFATQAVGTAALNLAFNYNKASIFFNFGTTGATAGERTYYFDDLKFGMPTQTITFPTIADKTVGDAAFALTATASSNLPVVYSTVSDKVTISGSTVTIVTAGRVVIKANQAGNAGFTAAPEVTQSFCIKPAKPTVTFTEPTAGTFLLTSSATAGNKWYKDGTLIASATNSTYSTTIPGIYKVQVTVDDCISEFSTEVPILVKGNQTINFPAITDKTVGNAPFSLTATASSTLAVAYSTDSDKVTISGSMVTIVKAGRAIIKANQVGNSSFNAAPEVTRSFCIKPAKPTITATGTDIETITLTSSATIGNKWFLNGTAIPSATNATFSANQPGIYKVQVTVDDCISEFSSDVPLIVTGDLTGKGNAVNVYPNPAEDYLELAGIKGELSNVQLVDLAGRRNPILFEKRGEVYRANVEQLTLGIYLLQVQDGTVIHRIKVIKK